MRGKRARTHERSHIGLVPGLIQVAGGRELADPRDPYLRIANASRFIILNYSREASAQELSSCLHRLGCNLSRVIQ